MGISPGDFERLQQRVASRGKSLGAKEPLAPLTFRRVLGIDPSLRGSGFGVIEVQAGRPRCVASGTIRCSREWARSRCLGQIAATVRDILRQHTPGVCAVEGLFFAQNLRTAITMGEARGAALAMVAEAGLPIYELAPRQVKQAIVGFGGAQKFAVAKMVQRMLDLPETPDADAADALALALAFAQANGRPIRSRLKEV
ncbi:MAG TPA: crossover junction endodeoxyribonuclease RuvC [Verrucomicrobiota bacterium]|nr:crossover junction endodeoxyribonuclease RuvC [Verrucomicrobiales bacterium]HRI14075.1 crossover junction endodeoxyribonuclease RuvC [Verrucomicrobiota bacterium]